MQLISQVHQIFLEKNLALWLRPYEILATGTNCGLIEFIPDALSIDSIKKTLDKTRSLLDYFKIAFGGRPRSKKLSRARQNFCKSLAGYSLVCYVL